METKDIAFLVVAVCAFVVSAYSVTLGPKNNLHSERIKLVAKALESKNAYGWRLGAYNEKPDGEPFNNDELHSGDPNEIVMLFNQANADLTSLDLIMPSQFAKEIADTKKLLGEVQVSFQKRRFKEAHEEFDLYGKSVDNLRAHLRSFLVE